MDIPVYRAKTLKGEWVEGYLFKAANETWCLQTNMTEESCDIIDIDPETLAIHFPDMIDKDDEPIFAAMNKSGIGGSYELISSGEVQTAWVWLFKNGCIVSQRLDDDKTITPFCDVDNELIKIAGIYEGETK